jgi:hypothetical protein
MDFRLGRAHDEHGRAAPSHGFGRGHAPIIRHRLALPGIGEVSAEVQPALLSGRVTQPRVAARPRCPSEIKMHRPRTLPTLSLSLALVLAALALPGSAFGQAARTWVSGVGDDINPCSRIAPCKTFTGATAKTAAGGEINILDAGGFGSLTITKSLTVKGHGATAGIAAGGLNGVVINAAPTDKVTLKGLDINGVRLDGQPRSETGVKVLSAKRVKLKNLDVYKFRAGVAVLPTSPNTRVVMTGSEIDDNGVGVIAAPAAGGDGARVTLRNNEITDNACGITATSHGANGVVPDATANCGAAGYAGFRRPVSVSAFRNLISDNGTGVFARGLLTTTEFGANDIVGNDLAGFRAVNQGVIRSYGDNHISNNGPNSTPPTELLTTG